VILVVDREIDGLLVVYPDGNVDAAGIARHLGDGIYRAVGGSAQCADLDGDGIHGLVALTADFEEVGNPDRPARAEAELVLEDEIDQPGVYPVRVLWDGVPAGEAVLRVRFIPAARP